MHTIYLGYSAVLSGDEMIRYFDIDSDHKDGISKFEQAFGGEYIEPGNFEVYDKAEYQNYEFDSDLVAKLLPFEVCSKIILAIDFYAAKSVFYVKTQNVSIKENDLIKLFGPLSIEKFNFE